MLCIQFYSFLQDEQSQRQNFKLRRLFLAGWFLLSSNLLANKFSRNWYEAQINLARPQSISVLLKSIYGLYCCIYEQQFQKIYIYLLRRRMESSMKLVFGVSIGLTLWNIIRKQEQIGIKTKSNLSNEIKIQSPKNSDPSQLSKSQLKELQATLIRLVVSQRPSTYLEEVQKKMSQFKTQEIPTLQNCTQATCLIFQYAFYNLILKNRAVKKKRNLFDRNTREGFHNYISFLIEDLQLGDFIITKSIQKGYELMKIDKNYFAEYKKQLINFKQWLKVNNLDFIPDIAKLNKTQIKEILQAQIYFYNQGSQWLIKRIIECCKMWKIDRKLKILKLISLIVIDESIAYYLPHVDEIQIENAKKLYAKQLGGLLKQLNQLSLKFYTQLKKQLGVMI